MAVGPDRFPLLFDQISSRCGEWRNMYAAVGVVVVGGLTLKLVWNAGRILWVHYGANSKQQDILLRKYGQWAIINGCNNEVGREFAVQFAKTGLDLILIAADDKQLTSEFIEEISSKYSVQCVRIYVNPSNYDELAFYNDIVQCVQDKNVGILLHNLQSVFVRTNVAPKEGGEDILFRSVCSNLFTVSILTNKILQSCFIQHRGCIIFVNDVVRYPSQLSPVKVAAKSYVNKLAERLHCSLRSKNVHVQLLTPSTICHRKHDPTWFTPSPSTYVTSAIRTIGRTFETTGYFPHTLQLWFTPNECLSLMWQNISARFRNR